MSFGPLRERGERGGEEGEERRRQEVRMVVIVMVRCEFKKVFSNRINKF